MGGTDCCWQFSYFWDHATGTPRTPRCSQIDPAPSGYSCAGDTTDWQAASNYLSGYPGDSAGSPTRKPATTTLNSFTERDETVWKMVTAAALSEARTHFGCSSLNGVEVENGGGSGTAGSHWEQRIFGNEMMTGVDRWVWPCAGCDSCAVWVLWFRTSHWRTCMTLDGI